MRLKLYYETNRQAETLTNVQHFAHSTSSGKCYVQYGPQSFDVRRNIEYVEAYDE